MLQIGKITGNVILSNTKRSKIDTLQIIINHTTQHINLSMLLIVSWCCIRLLWPSYTPQVQNTLFCFHSITVAQSNYMGQWPTYILWLSCAGKSLVRKAFLKGPWKREAAITLRGGLLVVTCFLMLQSFLCKKRYFHSNN